MTRAELHSTINKQGNMEIADAIDDVILHYEARTCETCKHLDVATCPAYDYEYGGSPDVADFSCNKWQPKD